MKTRLAIAALALLPVVGCGRSAPTPEAPAARDSTSPAEFSGRPPTPEGPEADDPEDAADEVRTEAPRPAEPTAEVRVRPVDFERLQALLPTLVGWSQSDARGEQVSTPVPYSRAEAIYHRDDSRIEVEIIDTGLSRLLLAPLSMFLATGFSERSTDGFRRAVRIGGSPAFEVWHDGSRRGEVTAVVADRFVVTAQGRGVSDLAPVRRAVESVDLPSLAGLK